MFESASLAIQYVCTHPAYFLDSMLEVLYTNDVAGEIKDCIVIYRSFTFSGFAGLFPGWFHLLVSFGFLEGLLPRFEWWPRWYIDVATQPGPTPNLV